jgi:hypothetical protein
MEGFSGCGNEPSASIKFQEFLARGPVSSSEMTLLHRVSQLVSQSVRIIGEE